MKSSKRLLFVALHRPGRSPSQRFRFEQFIPFLQSQGWQCDYAHALDEDGDKALYSRGAYFQKALHVIKGFRKRLTHMAAAKDYDVVFIQREAFITGSTFFERQFAKMKSKIVFDFDDAIWMLDISDANKNLSWLKDPSKTQKIIRISDKVLAGNHYLADFASRYNEEVAVLPTVVDTSYFFSKRSGMGDPIVIGWSGSQTTVKHFALAQNWMRAVAHKYGDRVRFKAICEVDIKLEGIEVACHSWNRETEVEDLDSFDIGVMPLPNDEWSKGKCGFKGIQYMSMSKPCLMSPVGVNPEIVEDGVNGFLPLTDEAWVDRISYLIENPQAAVALGRAGRKTIEERYSKAVIEAELLAILDDMVGAR